MKPVAFDYARPATLGQAIELLTEDPGAKVMAGGQTLGPMLNLRLARPSRLVDIGRLPELVRVEETAARLTLGACITHAAIEDARVPDPAGGLMRYVARDIAYRAVRNRGTIGGSLAHADPAADWVSCLIALDAEVVITGPQGERAEPVATFVRGALDTSLQHDEVLSAVRIPKVQGARYGYAKICRKTGEFADAIGAVAEDRDAGRLRIVVGATAGRPIVIEKPGVSAEAALASAELEGWLKAAGLDVARYAMNRHVAAVRRALKEALQR